VLFVFDPFGKKLLIFATLKMGIGHHTPKMNIPVADFSCDDPNLNSLLNEDGDESPPFNHFHFTDPSALIFHRPDLRACDIPEGSSRPQDAEAERHEGEFEHLFILFLSRRADTGGGGNRPNSNNILFEKWAIDCRWAS